MLEPASIASKPRSSRFSLSAAFSSLHSRNKSPCKKTYSVQETEKKSDTTTTLPSSSSASQIDADSTPKLMRASFDERTSSPRRPMSASSLLATINESASSRLASDDDEDEDGRPVSASALNGRTSQASSRQYTGSHPSFCSSQSSSPSSAKAQSTHCFCLPHRFSFSRVGEHHLHTIITVIKGQDLRKKMLTNNPANSLSLLKLSLIPFRRVNMSYGYCLHGEFYSKLFYCPL